MPKNLRSLYSKVPVYELTEEIKHPPYIVVNKNFSKLYQKQIQGTMKNSLLNFRSIESVFIRVSMVI